MPTCLIELRFVPMARRATTERKTPFGIWLTRTRTGWGEGGMTMETLADRIDTSPGVISMYERGLRNPKQDKVAAIARALVPDGLGPDEEETQHQRLLADGLRAAGFNAGGEIQYVFNPDTIRIAEAYDGAPEPIRRAFDALAESVVPQRKSSAEKVEEIERRNRIGKRPEDD